MLRTAQILLYFFTIPLIAISQVNDFCENAVQLSCGSTATGNLDNLNIDSRAENCYQSYRQGQGGQWYRITGTGDLVELHITAPNFQLVISVFQGDCNALICVPVISYPTAVGQPVVFVADLQIEYFIYIQNLSSYGTGPSDFDLIVNCSSPPGNLSCETATPVSIDELVEGSLDLTPFSYFACDYGNQSAQARWYSFMGDGRLIEVFAEAQNTGNNYAIYSSSCSTIECGNNYYLSPGSSGPLFETEAGRNYLLVIFSDYAGPNNQYAFTLHAFERAENATCSSASAIPCNDYIAGDTRQGLISAVTGTTTLWYSLKGNGNALKMSMNQNNVQLYIFTGTCDNLTLLTTDYLDESHMFNFLPVKGKTYLIGITSYIRPFSIKTECYLPPENDACLGAIELTCGSNYTGDASLATADFITSDKCYVDPSGRGLWYRLTGDNKIHSFRMGGSQINNLNIKLFEGGCGALECISETLVSTGQTADFFCKSNRKYWVLISSIGNERGLFSFRHDCFSPAPNDNCLNGIRLVAGNFYTGDARLSSPDRLVPCIEDANGIWYKVVGTGNIYEFLNFGNSFFTQTIMTGSCGALKCIQDAFVNIGAAARFSTVKNQVYYILIRNSNGPFSFLFNSITPSLNDVCDKATVLPCGVNPSGNFKAASHDLSDPVFLGPGVSTLWYELKGDNKIHEFKYQVKIALQSMAIFEGDCGDSNAQPITNSDYYSENPIRFFAESNKKYKICLYQETSVAASPDFILQHTCYERAINDKREGAIEVSCGEVISGSLRNAFQDAIDCYPYVEGVWYKMKGTGDVFNLKVDYGSITTLVSDENGLRCLDNYYGVNPVVLKSVKGEYYYFAIANTVDFVLSIDCIVPPVNDEMASPVIVRCGSVIEGDFRGATTDHYICQGVNIGIWYKITGTGDIFNISISNLSSTIYFFLHELDEQGVINCLGGKGFDTDGVYSFYPEPNKEYIFQLAIDHFADDSLPFTMQIDCAAPVKNDICNDAIEVSCGDAISLFNDFATIDAINSCYYGVAGVWFHLLGNDSAIQINVLEGTLNSFWIFEGKCGEFICNTGHTSMYFTAYQGRDYYIFIGSSPNEIVRFTLTCVSLPPGDLCSQAVDVQCGDSIDLFEYGLYNPDLTTECNYYGYHPGKWFVYNSEDYGTLTISNINELYSIEVSIFDGCNGNCLVNGLFPYNVQSLTISTEPGKKYYFLITSIYHDAPGQVYFRLSCTEDPLYISPCDQERNITDLLFPNELYPNGIIQSATRIQIANSVINPDGRYTWQAGESVEFQPGFEVRENARMEVKIAPCEPVAGEMRQGH